MAYNNKQSVVISILMFWVIDSNMQAQKEYTKSFPVLFTSSTGRRTWTNGRGLVNMPCCHFQYTLGYKQRYFLYLCWQLYKNFVFNMICPFTSFFLASTCWQNMKIALCIEIWSLMQTSYKFQVWNEKIVIASCLQLLYNWEYEALEWSKCHEHADSIVWYYLKRNGVW